MDSENFLIKLQKACEENNLSPAELVHYVIESKNTFNLTKRNVLRAGVGVGLLGAMAGSAFAAPTDQGQISAESGQFAKVEGPSDSTIIDLSGDIVDLQSTNRMVLPLYAGTNPSVVVGDFYYDTTSD